MARTDYYKEIIERMVSKIAFDLEISAQPGFWDLTQNQKVDESYCGPVGIVVHRLFLRNGQGNQLGSIGFTDAELQDCETTSSQIIKDRIIEALNKLNRGRGGNVAGTLE